MRVAAVAALAAASPVGAQSMPGMAMPGTAMPDRAMPGMAMPAPAGPPAPDAAPPPVPHDRYADRSYPAAAMAAARARMMREQGGQVFRQLLLNLAEAQVRGGRAGYRWDGEAWLGGDVDRAVVASEGSGGGRDGAGTAEVQALFSHAVGPYVDLQAGLRHDLAPTPTRTYASVGVEGLAPYMLRFEARGFVATTGQVRGRLEGWYDQRLTQRLVLQPRVELNLAAQDDAATRVGAGLADAELGLRLRYEVVREFAPYVGVSHDARTGRSARYARADGHGAATTALVLGVRCWF